MNAYAYNSSGEYIGIAERQIDPVASKREGKEVWLLPANSTTIAPPEFDPKKERAVWDGSKWAIDAIPPTPEPEPEPPTSPTTEERMAALEAASDRLDAQATYTAMMTDTLMEG